MFGSRRWRWHAGAAVVAMAVLAGCGSTPSAPPTATVQRGSVSQAVSASGSLSSVTSQNLGFANAGRMIELDARVGDVVRPGQLLAREDPFPYQQKLNEAQATLAQQQALLDKSNNDVSVPNAQRSVDAAQHAYDIAKNLADAQNDQARNATDRARVAMNNAQRALQQARAAADPSCIHGSSADESSSEDLSSSRSRSTTPSTSSGSTSGGSGGLLSGLASATATPVDCTAYNTAKSNYISAKTTYQQDKKAEDVTEETGRGNIASAKATLVTQQNTLDSSATDRPTTIAAQAAVVANNQALVAQAQRDLNDTSLFAPTGGTISAINGNVGEYMAAANSGTTALAPGSNASIPGVGAAATSDQSGNASSGISATKPGGGAFMVLNNINTFQVVVPFEESDAAKVQPNQKVHVTFDAVPDLERDGTVLSIAPNGVNISGVTNYYATILLTQSDPRLKDGMTAEANVVTNSLDNVLVVPNSAVIKQGGNSYVNTPGPDGKPQRTQFTPGAVGDDNTQVISGLHEGQQILLPQTGASPSGAARPSGSRGGGGTGGG